MSTTNERPFSIFTAPVRRLARRHEPYPTIQEPFRARPTQGDVSPPTPIPEVQSEVISAFQLHHVQVPDLLDRATHGAAIGARTAIAACAFTLTSVLGAGMWWVNRPAPRAEFAPSPVHTSHGSTSTRPGTPVKETPDRALEGAPHPLRAATGVSASPPALHTSRGLQTASAERRLQVNAPLHVANAEPAPPSSALENADTSVATLNKPSPIESLTAGAPAGSERSATVVPPTSVSSRVPVLDTAVPRVYRMKSGEIRPQGN